MTELGSRREAFSKASGHKTKNGYLVFFLLESIPPTGQGKRRA
jgi:hypothetical protein